jgi:hypothetical protein
MLKYTTYTVEGCGEFPFDMLRYDASYPTTSSDANSIPIPDAGPTTRRSVSLTHASDSRIWGPTLGRWESFGWRVTFQSK